MAMSSDLLPTYEMEEGEIVSPVRVDNYNGTIMTEIKNLRNEMQEMGDFDLPLMMEGCSDYREKTPAKESSLKVGDITFDEDGFRALWIAFIQQEKKIDQLERALNAMSGGDGKANPRITRDEMLQCMKNCMEEFGSNYGVSKQLMRKIVSQKLGIDIRGSSYLQKKFNAVMKYGLGISAFRYDAKDQMFHKV